MERQYKRVCYVCGKSYRYCSSCHEFKHLPYWMDTVCSEECHDIFTICAQYNLGDLDAKAAREMLLAVDADKKVYASKSVTKTVAELCSDTKAKKVKPVEVTE